MANYDEIAKEELDMILDGSTPNRPEPVVSKPDDPHDRPEPKASDRSLIHVQRGRLMPTDHTQLYRMAERIYMSGTSISGAGSPADVMVALMAGAEIGLGPAATIKSVYVVNGRPTLWGDAIVGIAQASGDYIDHTIEFEGEGDDLTCTCTVRRFRELRDGTLREVSFAESFSWDEAKTAGLASRDLWRKYPKRMLRGKAKTYAFREAFADLLAGFQHETDADEIAEFNPRLMRGAKRPDSGDALDAVLLTEEVGGVDDAARSE